MRFAEVKQQVLDRCTEEEACEAGYTGVAESTSSAELLGVLALHFRWCAVHFTKAEFKTWFTAKTLKSVRADVKLATGDTWSGTVAEALEIF